MPLHTPLAPQYFYALADLSLQYYVHYMLYMFSGHTDVPGHTGRGDRPDERFMPVPDALLRRTIQACYGKVEADWHQCDRACCRAWFNLKRDVSAQIV